MEGGVEPCAAVQHSMVVEGDGITALKFDSKLKLRASQYLSEFAVSQIEGSHPVWGKRKRGDGPVIVMDGCHFAPEIRLKHWPLSRKMSTGILKSESNGSGRQE